MWTAADYAAVINTLGVPVTLARAKPPSTVTANIKVGFAGISKEDQVLVNSYGINGKVITFKAVDVVATPPTKFDSVTMASGETYTIDTVVPVHLPGGAIVGFKAYIRGHQ